MSKIMKVVYGHKVTNGHVCEQLARITCVFDDEISRLVAANEITIVDYDVNETFVNLEFYDD